MIASDALRAQITKAGQTLRLRFYNTTYTGSSFDDSYTLALSGTLYISGVVQRIDSRQGSEDQVLLEQGRIRYNDSKIYINGSIDTASGARRFTVTLSGIDRVYEETDIGANAPFWAGTDLWKKIYLREIPLGSLVANG